MPTIYLLCPWHETGGPENLHQLCSAVNSRTEGDFRAEIIYFQAGPGYPPCPESGTLYTGPGFYDPATIRRGRRIEDAPDNVVVFPEILPTDAVPGLSRCRKAVWWLSRDYGRPLRGHHLAAGCGGVWHLFHARTTAEDILPAARAQGLDNRCLMLSDYIRESFWQHPWDPARKERLVAFNARKDTRSQALCAAAGLPAVGLAGLPSSGVMEVLARAAVYLDLGPHPGKDHLPREAAILGCAVVTNTAGCAASPVDLPIAEKADSDPAILDLLDRALEDPAAARAAQAGYREALQRERETFEQQVSAFLHALVLQYRDSG